MNPFQQGSHDMVEFEEVDRSKTLDKEDLQVNVKIMRLLLLDIK